MYIDQGIRKALSDRLYEKRSPAAFQVEQIVAKAYNAGNLDVVNGVISELSKDFAYALRHPNYRSGGLIALARVAYALGVDGLPEYLDDIIQPILACFGDADAKVRYYACESLFNIAKIAKGEILMYFNEIFDALCKLTADPDHSVKDATNLVDQVIRDIVVNEASTYIFKVEKDPPNIPPATYQPEGPDGPTYQVSGSKEHSFNLIRFIPLLVERIYVNNSATRIFLTTWIILLNSIAELELITYVPEFLEGLLLFLTDSNKEVRTYTRTCLNGLLSKIKSSADLQNKEHPEMRGNDAGLYQIGQDTRIYYSNIVDILLGKIDPNSEETKLVILDWLDGILDVSPKDVFLKSDSLCVFLLPSLSDPQSTLKANSRKLNDRLLDMMPEYEFAIKTNETVNAVCKQLNNEDEVCISACLQWLVALHNIDKFNKFNDEILNDLFKPLKESTDKVVSQILDLFGLVLQDSDDSECVLFCTQLIQLFRSNKEFFETRGRFIGLRLCVLLTPERVFPTFARIISHDTDSFSSSFIQSMVNILLMSPELHQFRCNLTQLQNKKGAEMFTTLFLCWKRDSIATLSLCLLAEAYEHAYACLEMLSKQNVTVSILVQIDKLIHYIEGPVFTSLRLHLLSPGEYPFLYKTLYGMLMFLPQSEAFKTLQSRLQCVSGIAALPQTGPHKMRVEVKNLVNWEGLLDEYRKAHGISYK